MIFKLVAAQRDLVVGNVSTAKCLGTARLDPDNRLHVWKQKQNSGYGQPDNVLAGHDVIVHNHTSGPVHSEVGILWMLQCHGEDEPTYVLFNHTGSARTEGAFMMNDSGETVSRSYDLVTDEQADALRSLENIS